MTPDEEHEYMEVPRDCFEKVVLIDDREFPRHTLREMAKIA